MTVVVPTQLDVGEPQLERTLTLQPGQLHRLFIQVPDAASSAGESGDRVGGWEEEDDAVRGCRGSGTDRAERGGKSRRAFDGEMLLLFI